MSTNLTDALSLGFSCALLKFNSTLTGPNQGQYKVTASPLIDGQREVEMLNADFFDSLIQNQTEVNIDGWPYMVKLKEIRDAGYYPTPNTVSHVAFPTIRFSVVARQ